MEGQFRQCPNGHYYQGATCPYCRSNGAGMASQGSGAPAPGKTEVFGVGMASGGSNQGGNTSGKTEVFGGGVGTGGAGVVGQGYGNTSSKTQVFGPGMGGGAGTMPTGAGQETRTMIDPVSGNGFGGGGNVPPSNRTVFGEEGTEMVTTPTGERVEVQKYRSTRKLVGWLVSYTLDPMGVDFKLYEGRNIIGREMDCNITVNDNTVSSKHAVLLFRAGKFSITDQQSTHGTFVNDQDIDLEPCYLQDGDVIRVGQTFFKFRQSI